MKNVYLSHLACEPLIEYLKASDLNIHLMTGKNTPVYDEVSTHADIHMCRLGIWDYPSLFMGDASHLTQNYPGNIIYNAVCTGKYFIHNLRHTDPELLTAARQWAYATSHTISDPVDVSSLDTLQFINVPQGYTRCCCLPVDDRSFITSDRGIAKALAAYDTNVLLIEKGHIALPGFSYGFIGGCAGHLTQSMISSMSPHRTIIFNGDLTTHPDYKKIAAFIQDRDIKLVYFKGHPLTDIGSILTD